MSDERFYLILLIFMAGVVAALVIHLALYLHRNFMTIAWDTAVLQGGIVNTMHGNWFSYSGPGGPNILGSHTTFLLLLFIPIYAVFPSVDTLFIVQIIGVYSTVIPLYLLGLEILRRPAWAFILGAGTLASPILLHMAMAPFHLETWIAAAALWSYYFYLRNRAVGFWAAFLFAVCCGEQAAMIYIALGLALLLVDDGLAWRKRYGLGAVIAGFGWIVLAVMVIAPIARGHRSFNIIDYNYTQWNIKSAPGLFLAVLHEPLKAFLYLVDPYRWLHVIVNIGLPLFVALFSRRSLLLLAPFPIYFLMCDQEFYLYFHAYYFQFIFFAGYLGVLFFLARWDVAGRMGSATLSALIFLNFLLLLPTVTFYSAYTIGNDEALDAAIHQAFDHIPADAGVYSPHRYSAYLSNRVNLVIGDLRDKDLDFNAMLEAKFPETNVHPQQIQYIVCDIMNDQCGWRPGNYDEAQSKIRQANVLKLVQSGSWKIVFSNNGVVILQRVDPYQL